MEPGMKLYYHGALIKTLGGCNFEKYEELQINEFYATINKN